ncbi:MAG: tape measure protein [Bacteroidaceae bacterium]|nr:tape measure protein [Bacteroidaceae bacterium]
MENLNGSLAYVATLDINDFNVSAEAMERHIRQVSTTTQIEAEAMEQSMLDFAQKGAMYIQAYLVGQGMTGLLNSIVQVRGQFQQLEIAFGTMLGNEQKAKALMDQMIDTAAHTPFDLMGVASGAKQLLAYGEAADKVNDTLVRLGNIASGLSIPLNDIVYLYGTTMVQGRLYAQDVRQFTGRGIPLVKELAKMYGVTAEEINNMVSAGKIGFPDVEKVINSLTDAGGQFYNLMEKQSASLTGMISNLEDAWDGMLNDIGTSNQDVFAGAISSATYLVENYQKILDILEAIVISYGSYKAAIVLNTLATKGYTGVALIDNTVRQAKIGLMKAEAVATGQVAAQTKAMQAAQEAHIATLEKELTAEELATIQKNLRIATIQSLLTAQQQEYISNLGLTTSSEGYEAAAMSVLSVEQRMSVSKLDLSANSAIYRSALEQEVLAKRANTTATLDAMRADVSAAARRVESTKAAAVAAMQRTEAARYEVYWAKQTGDATAIATAEKKLEAAQDNQAITRKAALAAQTDFHTKKKILETTATRQSTVASQTDTAAKTVQTTATNFLSVATTKATMALRALWATMKANPIGWLVTIIGMAVSAVTLFSDKEEEITEATGTLSNATKKATKEFNDQAAKVDALRKIIDDSNISYEQRNKALVELKSIVPGYNALLTQEGKIINNNTEAINKYLVALEKQIKLKAAQEELEEAYKKKRALVKTEREQSDEYWSTRQTNTAQGYDRDGFIGKTLRFFGAEDETNRKKELEKTQRELNDVNQQINSLNQEISETSVSMSSATTATKSYNEQVEETQEKIATLQKELSDMRSGSVSKDNLANAIQEKERELRAAQSDLAALTGKKTPTGGSGGSGSGANYAEQLAQKQLEAQRKLEEARIQVMEEGYAKRKAALDLQHQEALDRINKEEKELENAYKRAGKKGGLSANERAAFQERRNLEKQSYDTESTKLFDGEIEYKKRQYQAYFNWVKNVGQEVADSHFKTLIAEGSSFTSWVNKQIADLEAKQAAGTFTDGDANALNALKLQKDEIAGNKTAMDQFKESLQRAVGQAQTLAEKLQAVQELKDRLARGDFHLNEDDAAAAAYSLENQETELNQQVSDEVLNNYRTFEEKKLSITQEYTLLRNEAMKQGDAARLAQINQAEAEALSALNAQMLMQTDSWKDLFSDLDSLTVDQIEKLIADIRKRMSTADLKLNPADLKAVMDKLDEAKKKVLDTNPFKALGTALTNVFKKQQDGSKKTSKQIKTDWKDLSSATQGCFDFVNDAISSCSVLGDLIGDNGKATMDMIMGVTQAGIAMAAAIKTAEKASVILAAISMALAAIQWIATLFNNDDELQEEIEGYQRQIDSLGSAFNRLQNVMSHTYWEFTDEEEQAYRMRVKAVEDQIAALEKQAAAASMSWEFGKVAEYNKQIKELQYTLEKVKNTGDSLDLFEVQKENLRRQQDLIRQQIEAEKDKKDTDWGQIQKWEENIKDIDQQIEDLHRQEIELLAGTDVKSAIDEFADALVDAYCQGEDAAVALGEKTKEVLKKAVVESLKRQFLAKGINDAVDYLGESLRDGSLSDAERQHFTTMVNQAGNLFNQALEGIGDWIKDVEENTDPLTGAVMSMSEDTGGIIAGRLNAFIINQADQTAQLRAILIYQAQISQNTANTVSELKGIKTELQAIRNSGSSLLSQGIA